MILPITNHFGKMRREQPPDDVTGNLNLFDRYFVSLANDQLTYGVVLKMFLFAGEYISNPKEVSVKKLFQSVSEFGFQTLTILLGDKVLSEYHPIEKDLTLRVNQVNEGLFNERAFWYPL